VYLVDG
jgi:hypothetical protein